MTIQGTFASLKVAMGGAGSEFFEGLEDHTALCEGGVLDEELSAEELEFRQRLLSGRDVHTGWSYEERVTNFRQWGLFCLPFDLQEQLPLGTCIPHGLKTEIRTAWEALTETNASETYDRLVERFRELLAQGEIIKPFR